MTSLELGPHGYYEPATVEDLQQLVNYARAEGKRVRVRGSGHSVSQAIVGAGDDVLPVLLHKLCAVTITPEGDGATAIVEVEGGCHLGKSPYDPTGTSTWKTSLNYQVQQAGYCLDDLGGITHQTVAGFMATGSAGGSIKHTLADDIVRIQLVDGTGTLRDLSRDADDQDERDLFHAAGVSMGLMGVVVKVSLRVKRTYNIVGEEVTAAVSTASLDMFGDGTPERPNMERFLRETPYARLMWWPQHNFERVQVWQASRCEPTPDFQRKPYQELGRAAKAAALAGSLFYTIIGNLDDLSAVLAKLTPWYEHLEDALDGDDDDDNVCYAPPPGSGGAIAVGEVLDELRGRFKRGIDGHPELNDGVETEREDVRDLLASSEHDEGAALSDKLAEVITKLVKLLLDGGLDSWLGSLLGKWLKKELPHLIDNVLAAFIEDGTKEFRDTWMCGLPMDNQMDDQLWPTEFTELWIPVERSQEVMNALKAYYDGGGDADKAYKHTGSFSCEVYAAAKSPFWMSPAHEADVIRIDVFWFKLNAGDASTFYEPLWELLAPFGFRPHWGKVLPPASDRWRAYYRQQLPKLQAFLDKRSECDPDGVFLTDYWRDHLGI